MKTIVFCLVLLTCSVSMGQEVPTVPQADCQNCCLLLGEIANNGSLADFLDGEIDELIDQLFELSALYTQIINDPTYTAEQKQEAGANIQNAMNMLLAQVAAKQAELDALNSETHQMWELWLAAGCAGC